MLAVGEEARYLPPDLPVLLTGMGKVNAASAVAAVLAAGPRPRCCSIWARPERCARVGRHPRGRHRASARPGHRAAAHAHRRDLRAPLSLATEGAVLATGDTFVADDVARDRLAQRADLVDMEGTRWRGPPRGCAVPAGQAGQRRGGEGAARTWRSRWTRAPETSPSGPLDTSPDREGSVPEPPHPQARRGFPGLAEVRT
ncbi:nucleoside phosphorylase [Micromonospora sp. M12]